MSTGKGRLEGDQGVGETEQSGRQEAQPKGPPLGQLETAGAECCPEERDQRKQGGQGH